MKSAFVLIACASLLAACGGQRDNRASNDAAAKEVTATESATGLQAGFWETRVEVKNVTVLPVETPQGTFTPTEISHSPPQTNRYCVTPEQASQPFRRFLTGGVAGEQCDTARFSMTDGRISGSVVCELQGERSEYSLDGQYTPASYTVTTMAKTRMTTPAQEGLSPMSMPMDVETLVTGRRLGDCPANDAGASN